jgi:hypothetical protein
LLNALINIAFRVEFPDETPGTEEVQPATTVDDHYVELLRVLSFLNHNRHVILSVAVEITVQKIRVNAVTQVVFCFSFRAFNSLVRPIRKRPPPLVLLVVIISEKLPAESLA